MAGITLDSRRNELFQTKLALILTVTTVLLLSVLSWRYGQSDQALGERTVIYRRGRRQLDDVSDYSAYSCGDLYAATTSRSQQCVFARTCNGGEGIWAPFIYCSSQIRPSLLALAISPLSVLYLVLLFRLLGSTAEDYFSPALEMFCVRVQLPPRLAGVTLLALGNGAADVSAVVAAMASDPVAGYQFAASALTGGAMFISTVISSTVILVAGGIPCRGALVRDVTALALTAVLVHVQFKSSGSNTTTTLHVAHTVGTFLTMYFLFVGLVLVADVYHRAVVLPRQAEYARVREQQRQVQLANAATASGDVQVDQGGLSPPAPPGILSNVLTSLSNYDQDAAMSQVGWTTESSNMIESDDLARERPIFLHGSRGSGVPVSSQPLPLDESASHYTALPDGTALLVRNTSHARGGYSYGWSETLRIAHYEIQEHFENVWQDIAAMGNQDVDDYYTVDAFFERLTKFLLLCELPMTWLRKITVPIPCEGYYVRGLVALALAVGPIWFTFYLWYGQGMAVFSHGHWVYHVSVWAGCALAALLFLRFALPTPSDETGEQAPSLLLAAPIGLFGFVIAATWIDTIADQLVSLLDFMGIVLGIPGPIIGLTVLAWGNSMSDLSANITMARKGLANMAMTACFAGPVFNILVGLGLGFSSLAAQTGSASFEVSESPSLTMGLLFLGVNSICIVLFGLCLGNGRIPKKYGYIGLGIYSLYLIAAISLQFASQKAEE
jgi:solute carrier family 24 (sodium/potassium/calcium exchanger), member 6